MGTVTFHNFMDELLVEDKIMTAPLTIARTHKTKYQDLESLNVAFCELAVICVRTTPPFPLYAAVRFSFLL